MNAHVENPRVREWIDRARAAPLLEVAQKVGAKLKRAGVEWVGPCPGCGGTDRFAINTKERVWNCRGAEGGSSVIDMVMHAQGCSFVDAVEIITGEARPSGTREETDEELQERARRQAKLQADAEARREREEKAAEAKRRRDEEAVDAVLRRAVPIQGTHAEAYLRARGLTPARRLTGDLKFVPELDYWGWPDEDARKADRKVHLATLPAMVAIVRDAAGAMIGIHQTFLDPGEPRKWAPVGSRENKPKKIRGEAKGGLIRLGMLGDKLATGEGIETTLAWHALGYGPEDISLAAAISLGNLAGGCTGSAPHPTAIGRNGKPVMIRNGVPDMGRPGVILPDDVRELILLGDGDSEPLATRAAILTAGRRFHEQGRTVAIQFAPSGQDFNDVLCAQRAEMERAA